MYFKLLLVIAFVANAESFAIPGHPPNFASPTEASTELATVNDLIEPELKPTTLFELNNDYTASLPTTVNLTVLNKIINCQVDNLVPNNGYMINFYRNDVQFAFFRIRSDNVIYSTMNLNQIRDFFPTQYSNNDDANTTQFAVKLSPDSTEYGVYQCSAEILDGEDNKKTFTSKQVHLFKEKPITPAIRWNRVFPTVNVNYSLDYRYFEEGRVYQAKCQTSFSRPIENYSVCFMIQEGLPHEQKILGCYDVRDYDKDVKWQYKFTSSDSNITVLEDEANSKYPEFSILIRHMKKSERTWCKVFIPSKKHPIRFSSNLIQLKNSLKEISPYYITITATHERQRDHFGYSSDSSINCSADFEREFSDFVGGTLALIDGNGEVLQSLEITRGMGNGRGSISNVFNNLPSASYRCQATSNDGQKFTSNSVYFSS